jgi:hypothetical protein
MVRLISGCLATIFGLIISLSVLPTLATDADLSNDFKQVLVIHPGIWHVWFDEKPSQDIIDLLSESKNQDANRTALLLQAVHLVKESGQYIEKPVWLLNFHWEPLIKQKVQSGIPVYVTVEPGINMYEAKKELRFKDLSTENIAWLKEHSFSGGTLGAKRNHLSILDTHRGILALHSKAEVAIFIHSQSGPNFLGAMKSIDSAAREEIAKTFGPIVFWDPALKAPRAEFLENITPFNEKLYKRITGHEMELSVKQLIRKDAKQWEGKRYLDWVNASDLEFDKIFDGIPVYFLRAKGTVSSNRINQWANRLGAKGNFNPADVGALGGLSGLSTFTAGGGVITNKDGEPVGFGKPWIEPVDDHNFSGINDLAARLTSDRLAGEVAKIALKGNPAYASQFFENNTVLTSWREPVAKSDSKVSQDSLSRIENISVWNGAKGSPVNIAEKTVRAAINSGRDTVVLDPTGQEQFAQQIAGRIKSMGGLTVTKVKGLNNQIMQTTIGEKMDAVVVKLAPNADDAERMSLPSSEAGANIMTANSELPFNRLIEHDEFQINADSLVKFNTNLRGALNNTRALAPRSMKNRFFISPSNTTVEEREDSSEKKGQSIYEGRSVVQETGSNWYRVQLRKWDKPEYVYDATDDSADKIIDEIISKITKENDGKVPKGTKVVIAIDNPFLHFDSRLDKVSKSFKKAGIQVISRPIGENLSTDTAVKATGMMVHNVDAAAGLVFQNDNSGDSTIQTDTDDRIKIPAMISQKKKEIQKEKDPPEYFPTPPVMPPLIDPIPWPYSHVEDESPDRVTRELQNIVQRIRSQSKDNTLEAARVLREAEEGMLISPRVRQAMAEQSEIVALLNVLSRKYDKWYYRLRDPAGFHKEPAIEYQALKEWQKAYMDLRRTLLGINLSLQAVAVRDSFQLLLDKHERLYNQIRQPAIDSQSTRKLPNEINKLAEDLHFGNWLILNSLSLEMQRANLLSQRLALDHQIEVAQVQIAKTMHDINSKSLANGISSLPERIKTISASLVQIQDELDRQSIASSSAMLANRMRTTQQQIAILNNSIRSERFQKNPEQILAIVTGVENKISGERELLWRMRTADNPVVLQSQFNSLEKQFGTMDKLLSKGSHSISPKSWRTKLFPIQQEIARTRSILQQNHFMPQQKQLNSDLSDAFESISRMTALLNRETATTDWSKFNKQIPKLKQQLNQASTSLQKTNRVLQPLVLEDRFRSLRQIAGRTQQLLRNNQNPVNPLQLGYRIGQINNQLNSIDRLLSKSQLKFESRPVLQQKIVGFNKFMVQSVPPLNQGELGKFQLELHNNSPRIAEQLSQVQSSLLTSHLEIKPLAIKPQLDELNDILSDIGSATRPDSQFKSLMMDRAIAWSDRLGPERAFSLLKEQKHQLDILNRENFQQIKDAGNSAINMSTLSYRLEIFKGFGSAVIGGATFGKAIAAQGVKAAAMRMIPGIGLGAGKTLVSGTTSKFTGAEGALTRISIGAMGGTGAGYLTLDPVGTIISPFQEIANNKVRKYSTLQTDLLEQQRPIVNKSVFLNDINKVLVARNLMHNIDNPLTKQTEIRNTILRAGTFPRVKGPYHTMPPNILRTGRPFSISKIGSNDFMKNQNLSSFSKTVTQTSRPFAQQQFQVRNQIQQVQQQVHQQQIRQQQIQQRSNRTYSQPGHIYTPPPVRTYTPPMSIPSFPRF